MEKQKEYNLLTNKIDGIDSHKQIGDIGIMSKYYFVTYENRGKTKQIPSLTTNTILNDVHPVIWASTQRASYNEYYTTYILFWKEIPEDVAKAADYLNFFTIESKV